MLLELFHCLLGVFFFRELDQDTASLIGGPIPAAIFGDGLLSTHVRSVQIVTVATRLRSGSE